MSIFAAAAALITLTAVLAYLNERLLKLPAPIGVMLGALIASLASVAIAAGGLDLGSARLLETFTLNDLLMKGMLSFLLFAGALHVDLADLNAQRWPILTLATVGVVLSTFFVAVLTWSGARLVGFGLPFGAALVFGALISPTDPIAVIAILRDARVPKGVETLITGESLFNDGVGVVVFTIVLGTIHGAAAGTGTAVTVVELFLGEAVGGIAFGLLLGLVAYRMLKSVDNYTVEVLITLAVVTGGYSLAQELHTSGPIAMVVAGLLVGNQGRAFAMSERTREHLDTFWEMTDEILNAVLFVLIGLEFLVIRFEPAKLFTALVAIPLVLVARFGSVGLPVAAMRLVRPFPRYTVRTMTWGALRGGISVALALSLPAAAWRDGVVGLTYGVVVFSILVQGLTVGRVAARMRRTA
jgi:CPA1 family monovalent cation:H+ antiporter